MSAGFLLRIFFGALFSGVLAWSIYDREDGEAEAGRLRYRPYLSGVLLPSIVATLLVVGAIKLGLPRTAELVGGMLFAMLLHICVYDGLLLLLLPLLRRHFSARACAVLWMLPNYLYLVFSSRLGPEAPALVLRVSDRLWTALLAVWAAGAAAVLLWRVGAHLAFRRRILKDARPVCDSEVLAVWEAELADAGIQKPKFRLLTSPAVTTPLSIGLFQPSTRVVLPQKAYSQAELHLLLRHELVHISRQDAANKFFLVFCCAMCWFNPLLWVARRKSADDLELSCDETVLLREDEPAKRQYAALLLNTAGDERGFTTCLSASATALRYRLKNVVAPRKKRSGALLVGLAFFLLFMTCGYVTLAYDAGTGGEALFHGAPEAWQLESVSVRDGGRLDFSYTVTDEAALKDYLASLELCRLTGDYSTSGEERLYVFLFDTPQGTESIDLGGNVLRLVPLHGPGRLEVVEYYIPGGVDRAYLDSLLSK